MLQNSLKGESSVMCRVHPSIFYQHCPALRGLVCSSCLPSWTLQCRATLRQTTIHSTEFSIKPPVHIFGLWEEARVPRENPRRYTENMQIPGGWNWYSLMRSRSEPLHLYVDKLKTPVLCNPTHYSYAYGHLNPYLVLDVCEVVQ